MFDFVLLLVKELHSRVWFSWSMIKIIDFIVSISIITTAKVLVFFLERWVFLQRRYIYNRYCFISHVNGIVRKYGIASYHNNDIWFGFSARFVPLSMWLLDFWFNNCHCEFLSGEYLFSFIFYSSSSHHSRRTGGDAWTLPIIFMLSYKRRYCQRSFSNAS
jgi:hypothetical protein